MLLTKLHPFQNEAVDRGLDRGNLLIAWEMGLGKTLAGIAIAETLLGEGEIRCATIVCDASLKYQWAEAIAKHTDVDKRTIYVMNEGTRQAMEVPTEEFCIIIDGPPKTRAALYEKALKRKPDYIILGYTNVVSDWAQVRRTPKECHILDEITAIKTFKAQRTKKIKRFQATYRYGLTGTPMENGKPEETYSIMQYIDPYVLGGPTGDRFDLFDRTYIVRNGYGGVMRYRNLPVLHAKLSVAMSRKTAEDPEVAPYLPEVFEKDIPVDLDAKTRKAYKAIAAHLLAELQQVRYDGSFDVFAHYQGEANPNENSQQGKIMARMQALDMLLDHPDLIVASGIAYQDSQRQRDAGVDKKNWPGSKYCYDVWQSGLLDDVLTSPKLDAAVGEINTALAANPKNKVIVFSFFREMIDIIQDSLPEGISVQYHGGMNASQKAAAKAKFTQDPDCRVFISSHAGAKGTDLYMANYLLNYDMAWSAGQQDQINARHRRASSLFEHIRILNMICRNTTEPRKKASVAFKRKTARAVIDGKGADSKGRVENDLESLTEHLRKAA